MPVFQPSNQIRLTNVSLVRMRKNKKRFEVACYKNKVLEYRSGTENDLDNVLQIPTVFLNVSKGEVAPSELLRKCFGTDDQEHIILEILKKGELQVGEKERKSELDRLEREVLEMVAARCVDPRSGRVYTTGMIEKALELLSKEGGQQATANANAESSMPTSGTATPSAVQSNDVAAGLENLSISDKDRRKPIWTGVVTTKSAKSQALDAMKALVAWQPIPIIRARMRLRIVVPTSFLSKTISIKPSATSTSTSTSTDAQAGSKSTKSKKNHKTKSSTPTETVSEDQQLTASKSTVKEHVLSYVEQIESQDASSSDWEVVGFVEPGAFKGLGEFVSAETRGRGRVEVLDMAVTHEDRE